jgi:hypothetical protein
MRALTDDQAGELLTRARLLRVPFRRGRRLPPRRCVVQCVGGGPVRVLAGNPGKLGDWLDAWQGGRKRPAWAFFAMEARR